MARYRGPKNKLSRRENMDLFNKGTRLRRLNVPPGIHGHKAAHKKVSEYGSQLREKQKVKRFYGVLERQFKNYYKKAAKHHGASGQILLQLLERRLDNFLVRAGLCPTRPMARQLIVHNHVLVNGKIVNRPSYQLSPDEVVTLGSKAMKIPAVDKLLNNSELQLPKWIQSKGGARKMVSLPKRSDIPEDFNEQVIVEFYSR